MLADNARLPPPLQPSRCNLLLLYVLYLLQPPRCSLFLLLLHFLYLLQPSRCSLQLLYFLYRLLYHFLHLLLLHFLHLSSSTSYTS